MESLNVMFHQSQTAAAVRAMLHVCFGTGLESALDRMPNLESLNVNGCIMLGRLAPRHCLRLRSMDAVGCAALRTLSSPSPALRSLAVQACSELVVRPRPGRLKRSKVTPFWRAAHMWTASWHAAMCTSRYVNRVSALSCAPLTLPCRWQALRAWRCRRAYCM